MASFGISFSVQPACLSTRDFASLTYTSSMFGGTFNKLALCRSTFGKAPVLEASTDYCFVAQMEGYVNGIPGLMQLNQN